jgi:asparagine synthase (glutamine-hydrolysing)
VDHELVEHVFPLPDRVKVGLGTAKHLLRNAVRDRLPVEHFRAPKRGFVGPMATWLRGELREMLTDELSSERVRRLGLFAPAAIAGFLSDHFTHRHDRSRILWELLCFSTWYRISVEDSTMPALSVA